MSRTSEDFQGTCRQIQHQLSMYLDGALSTEDETEVLAHLEQCRDCTERLSILKQVQTAVQHPLEAENVPDFTGSIMEQLDEDMEASIPCEYDYEFVSAYVDNALVFDIQDPALLKQRIGNFEQHLPLCTPCNDQLGELLELRTTLSRYHSRLEESFNLDFTEAVMCRFQQEGEEEASLPMVGCGVFSYEDLSAHVDQEWQGDAEQQLQEHLAQCADCRGAVSALTQLQEAIAGYGEALALGPYPLENVSLWPDIERQLAKETVIPFRPSKKKIAWRPLAATSAVAAVFLAFVAVKMGEFSTQQHLALTQPVPTAAIAEFPNEASVGALNEPKPTSPAQWSTVAGEDGRSQNRQLGLNRSDSGSPNPTLLEKRASRREVVQLVTVEYISPEDYLFAEQTEILRNDALEKGASADYVVFADY